MAATARRAVLTGMGVLSPLGCDPTSLWASLQAGKSGVRPITHFDPSGLPVQFGGSIPDFDPRKIVPKDQRKNLKTMARTIQLAVAMSELAIAHGKVDKKQLDPTRFGVEFGAAMIANEPEEFGEAALMCAGQLPGVVDLEKWGHEGMEAIQPLWMLKYLPNFLACQVSILHDAQGPNNSITENEVAPLLAIGEAWRILQRDDADFFLVGGADHKTNPLSMARQSLFEKLSQRNDAPEKACRPFDRQRDGLVLGEGGACLVLEELGHANRRGATVYGELCGFAAGFDRRRDGSGLARVIRLAMSEAGVTPADLDHVNAQGFSGVEVDRWEAHALNAALGDECPPVFAAKSYFGNLGAGSTPVELAISLLALQHGTLPPTLNYEEPDPECPIPVLADSPHTVRKPYFLKLSFTALGQCAALVVRKV